jgi:hypothetical protein
MRCTIGEPNFFVDWRLTWLRATVSLAVTCLKSLLCFISSLRNSSLLLSTLLFNINNLSLLSSPDLFKGTRTTWKKHRTRYQSVR